MHELSIAAGIVESVRDAALREGLSTVSSIRVRVGTIAGVCVDSLRFCFNALEKPEPLAGCSLEISLEPAVAACRRCGHEYDPTVGAPLRLVCPKCSFRGADVLAGRDIVVEFFEGR